MADINRCITFNQAHASLISSKLKNPAFCHKNWSDEDLQELRREIRNFYRQEQKGICSYCRNPLSLTSVNNCHIEHVAPKAVHRDFIFEPKNLCVICADCNEIKRAQETANEVVETVHKGKSRKKYPRSSNAFKIVHPHFDNYDDHILILNGGFYVDQSKKGHFTIGACNLNRRLYAFGWEKVSVENDKVSELMFKYLKAKNPAKRQQILQELKLQIPEA